MSGISIYHVAQPKPRDFADARALFAGISGPSAVDATEILEEFCHLGDGHLIFAELDGRRVAAALVNSLHDEISEASLSGRYEISDYLRDRCRIIELLAVDPEHRNADVGSRLVQWIELQSFGNGVTTLTAVIEENAPSLDFFRGLGYSVRKPGDPLITPTPEAPSIAFPVIAGHRWVQRNLA